MNAECEIRNAGEASLPNGIMKLALRSLYQIATEENYYPPFFRLGKREGDHS